MITRRALLASFAMSPFLTAFKSAGNIKIGVCTRDSASALKYGFDYIEPAAAEIASMSEDDFRDYSGEVLASPIRCRAFNGLIRRPDLKVVGNEVSLSALRDYLEPCLIRCKRLGAAIAVWGSAGSRNVPEGFARHHANEQIAEFLHMAGDVARQHELVIAIEPLRHQEGNILNTGAEALEMVRSVKHPNVRMIIDYYHLREENEDPKILETAQREIVHLHFANPHGRVWPHDLAEDDHYADFFRYLKKTGYSGGISIEGKGTFDNDASASRAFFRAAIS
jgi:D-psicose/D-tagatose/L-ribulose 3-epimerase